MKKGFRFTKPKDGEFILRDGWTMPKKPCKRGHLAPRTTNGTCAQCLREYRKERKHFHGSEAAKSWREENKEHINQRRREYSKEFPERAMLNSARRSAKIKSVPFNLDESDINIPDVCPVLGLRLARGSVERTHNSPSLDRIIPELGYTKGNVVVVSWRANRIKADATVAELALVYSFYSTLIATKD